MKKILVLAVALVSFATMSYAEPRAIGGRITNGLEFSYEHGLGDNMLSIDAGWNYGWNYADYTDGTYRYHSGFWVHNLEAAVTYDWINPGGASFASVWHGRGEWNWYLGVGAGAGYMHTWAYSYYTWGGYYPMGFVGAAGRVGVEYNFWFPLQLSIDWRPIIGPCFGKDYIGFNYSGLYSGGLSLGVRYRF